MSPAPGTERLRVVLDTNVYIASFAFPKGRTAVLWRAAREGRYRLLVSPAIIQEMAGVLRADFGWEDDRVQKAIRRVCDVADDGIVVPSTTIRAVSTDPDDNRILECAMHGKADIIVSNDHHLLDLKAYGGVPIIAGVDFRRTLGLK
jgi:uncharacterized protein